MAFEGWKAGGWKKGWRLGLWVTVASLLGAYILYCIVVVPSNGTNVHVFVTAGTSTDGSMYLRCDPNQSTPGSCDAAGTDGSTDHMRIHVHKRDKVTMTVHSLDGPGRTHDFHLVSWGWYFLPPARLEMELHKETETKSFTAYKGGEFRIICELPGHEDRGMWGTIVIE